MNGPNIAPGWYPDPAGSGGMRWWDGQAWNNEIVSSPEPSAAAAPSLGPSMVGIGVAIAVLVLLGVVTFFVAKSSSHRSSSPLAHASDTTTTTTTFTPTPVVTPTTFTPLTFPPTTDAALCGCTDVPGNRDTVPPAAPPAPVGPTTAMPTNGLSAVIEVDASADALTVETNAQDVRYSACPSFTASSPSGADIGLSGLRAGDFGLVIVDPSVPCVKQVTVDAPPRPPACQSAGYGGGAEVTWIGYNEAAHSVLYRPTGANESVLAGRWCQTPTAAGADGSAISLASIPPGSDVELLFSNGEWTTGVTVKS